MVVRIYWFMLALMISASGSARETNVSHAFAILGAPKYASGFTHFDYVNPQAPKGGQMTLSVIGTFDNFNRYALRGNPAERTGQIYDSLFTTSDDEPGSYYPLIATSARHPDNFAWAEIALNPQARFHDGSPITSRDVAFTFHKFMTEGVPQFRLYYKGVTVSALGPHTVRITLAQPNKETMLSLLTLPVMPEKYWRHRSLGAPLAHPPLGSGPYRITDWRMGQYVVWQRVADYWGASLPVNRGRWNFDTLRYDYYLDDNVAFEAFKAGAFDIRRENNPKNWATRYTGRHFERGYIVKAEQQNSAAQGTRWLAFNLQRPLFSDRRVREAIALAFDFEWMNKALFYGAYRRANSYFQNTEYAARALPDAGEQTLLAPFKNQLPAELFHRVFQPPHTSADGFPRDKQLAALKLLRNAGWTVKNKRLINGQSGKPFEFELLLPAGGNNAWALPFQHSLARVGIRVTLRQVDNSQLTNRLRRRDFDMMPALYPAMPWPGTDLQISWASAYLDSSWNTPGVQDPIVDKLIAQIAAHQGDKARLLPLGRALDRVLTWQYYMLPMWYQASERLSWWNKFARPSRHPGYALGLDTWWYDSAKAAALPPQRR